MASRMRTGGDKVEDEPSWHRPLLILNPPDDAAFATAARDLVRRCQSPEDLRRRLQARYPRVVVRERELSGELTRVWYVYRDGRWTRGTAASLGGSE